MATWQEIGQENFRAARDLYDTTLYRSSVSRFYYSAFSVLMHELVRRAATFRLGWQTPSHTELPRLIVRHLTQFTEVKRNNVARVTTHLYRSRLDADYQLTRVDKRFAGDTLRDAVTIFEYLGVPYDR